MLCSLNVTTEEVSSAYSYQTKIRGCARYKEAEKDWFNWSTDKHPKPEGMERKPRYEKITV
jgi:hypothetical protein